MKKSKFWARHLARFMAVLMVLAVLPALTAPVTMAANNTIENDQFRIEIGDLGQIRSMYLKNNRTTYTSSTGTNTFDPDLSFMFIDTVGGRNTSTAHQFTGELLFSTRSAATVAGLESATFAEQDTNKTLAQGTSKTSATATLTGMDSYYEKTAVTGNNGSVINKFIGGAVTGTSRVMRGYDAVSTFDMNTTDGSILWTVQVENKSDRYIEFGDIGIPISWNDNYNGDVTANTIYQRKLSVHSGAGIDSGYVYGMRASGEGGHVLFAPVPESGARIEYIDQWFRNFQGITGERNNSTNFYAWAHDSTNWQSGLRVCYIHSKAIKSTGAGYHMDNTSLILAPGEKSPAYQFKFFPIRADGDFEGGPTNAANPSHPVNDNSRRTQDTERNQRSALYNNSMIDIDAVPGFQPAINMPAKIDLHYNKDKIRNVTPRILCVHQEQCTESVAAGHVHGRDCDYNDPWASTHIPIIRNDNGLSVSNHRGYHGVHNYYDGTAGKPLYTKSIALNTDKAQDGFFQVDGEWHQVYDMNFACIGNNSVRIDYELKVGDTWVPKFTQSEFNVMDELAVSAAAHSDWTHRNQTKTGTYKGIYVDSDLHVGPRTTYTAWGDDWSHAHYPMMANKNLMQPVAAEILGLLDYADWAAPTAQGGRGGLVNSSFRVNNWRDSSPGGRTFSELTCALGFYGIYKVMKAYPELVDYGTRSRMWYLNIARGIMINTGMTAGNWGKYGEQEIVNVYEDMLAELNAGETAISSSNVTAFYTRWINDRGTNRTNERTPYVSEFPFDNTGDEAAYAWPQAVVNYNVGNAALQTRAKWQMAAVDMTTRAKRGMQPNWFDYSVTQFLGGESWWGFQYTTGFGSSIMDDYIRLGNAVNQYTAEERALANRRNYAAKIAHFNCINVGQIVGPRPGTATTNVDNFGAMGFRISKAKGGRGDQNSNGYNGVRGNGMNLNAAFNNWYSFSGEADQGVYAAMLRVSTDVVTDPTFGTFAYGGVVTDTGTSYELEVRDGFGKRVNFLNEMFWLQMSRDKIVNMEAAKSGNKFEFEMENETGNAHNTSITLQGLTAGTQYFVYVDEAPIGTAFFTATAGSNVAEFPVPAGATYDLAVTTDVPEGVIVTADASETENKFANLAISLKGTVFSSSAHTSLWTVENGPAGAVSTFSNIASENTTFTTDLAGEYTIRFSASNVDGDSDYKDVVFTVIDRTALPAPVITAMTVPAAAGLNSATAMSVTATTTTAAPLSYAWSMSPTVAGNVIADATTTAPKITLANYGTYAVTVVVTDLNGKTATQTKYISAGDTTPGPYAPDDDGLARQAVYTAAQNNIARAATVTADAANGTSAATNVNNGGLATGTSSTAWNTWGSALGTQTTPVNIWYTWSVPHTIDAMRVLWWIYTDSGVNWPRSATVEYWNLDTNSWSTTTAVGVDGNSGGGANRPTIPVTPWATNSTWNAVRFDPPITTTQLRLNCYGSKTSGTSPGLGISEWEVFGVSSADVTVGVDKTRLANAITDFQSKTEADWTAASWATAAAADAAGMLVFLSGTATSGDVEAAAIALEDAILALEVFVPAEPVDLGQKITYVTTGTPTGVGFISSFTNGAIDTSMGGIGTVLGSNNNTWNRIAGLNSSGNEGGPFEPTGSNVTNNRAWATWGNSGPYWVLYDFGAAYEITGTSVYWNDNLTSTTGGGTQTDGGIAVPASWVFEYKDSTGAWQPVTLLAGETYGTEIDQYNDISFEPVLAQEVRVSMVKQGSDGANPYVGIVRWKVWGIDATAPVKLDAPTGFVATDSVAGGSTGSISGFDPATMEWATTENAATWSTAALANLAAGTYYIRNAGVAGVSLASDATAVVVGELPVPVLKLGAGQGTTMAVKVGAFKQIVLDTTYASGDLIFSCGNSTVKVDANGNVIGLKAGTAVVVVRSADGKNALSIMVIVG